jgi:hypothetical protein
VSNLGQSPIFDPDDTDKKSKRMRVVANVIFAALVFGGWIYFFISPRSPGEVGASDIGALSVEFNKISLPQGVARAGGLLAKSKSASSLVSQEFVATTQPDYVLDHYSNELKGNGWYFRRNISAGGSLIAVYCKEDMEASLELASQVRGDPLYYSFSISSGQVSSVECKSR